MRPLSRLRNGRASFLNLSSHFSAARMLRIDLSFHIYPSHHLAPSSLSFSLTLSVAYPTNPCVSIFIGVSPTGERSIRAVLNPRCGSIIHFSQGGEGSCIFLPRGRDIFARVRLSRAEASRFMHGQIYIDLGVRDRDGQKGKNMRV